MHEQPVKPAPSRSEGRFVASPQRELRELPVARTRLVRRLTSGISTSMLVPLSRGLSMCSLPPSASIPTRRALEGMY
jgi:hypothetical protein